MMHSLSSQRINLIIQHQFCFTGQMTRTVSAVYTRLRCLTTLRNMLASLWGKKKNPNQGISSFLKKKVSVGAWNFKEQIGLAAVLSVRRSRRWLKIGLFGLFLIVLVPVSLWTLPDLIQYFVYTHRRRWILSVSPATTVNTPVAAPTSHPFCSAVRVPFFIDLSRPAELSLNHTINMYLTSEEGISLGVWWV